MAGKFVLYDDDNYDLVDDRDDIDDLIEVNDFDADVDPKRYVVYEKIGYLRTDGVKFYPVNPKIGKKGEKK
jgi:hypothetical protein